MSPVPADDPAGAFICATRSLRLRYSRSWIRQRFQRHDQPNSLQALVDLAPDFGVEVIPCRCDTEQMAEEGPPAILHFQNQGGGFAALIAVEPQGITVEETVSGRRTMKPDEFEASWSGIAVFLDFAENPGIREPGYLYHRLKELLPASWQASGSTGGFFRGLGTAIVIALVAGAALRGRAEATPELLGPLGLSSLMTCCAFLSGALFKLGQRRHTDNGFARRICRGNDCSDILDSRWAQIGRIPIAALGLAWFASGLLMPASTLLLAPHDVGLSFSWLTVIFVISAPISIVLLARLIWPGQQFCRLCAAIHMAVLTATLLVWWTGILGAAWQAGVALWPFAALHGVFFLLVLGFLVPGLEARLDLAALRARVARSASSPLAALAQSMAAPKEELEDGPILVGEPSALVTIDVIISPSCAPCKTVVDELTALADENEGIARISFHPMPGRRGPGPEHELCTALAALGLQGGAKAALTAWAKIKEDPEYWISHGTDGAGAVMQALHPDLEENIHLQPAREAVDRTTALFQKSADGLPALFLNRRLFGGAPSFLRMLLRQHRHLIIEGLDKPRPAVTAA